MRNIVTSGLAIAAVITLMAASPAQAQGNSQAQVGPGSAANLPGGNPNQATPNPAARQPTDGSKSAPAQSTQAGPDSVAKQRTDGNSPTQVGPGSGAYKK
jgi:hypothetical protein